MVICIRYALQVGSTGEWATHFSGYVVTLLVIFYLQIEKKLPSVSSLQSGVKPVKCGGEYYGLKRNINKNQTYNCGLYILCYFLHYLKFEINLLIHRIHFLSENMVHYNIPSKVAICKDRIRDLLIGFFSYYQNFDFINKIISPFEGCEIHKNFRNKNPDSMSPSMYR